jgi:SET domain-containing protein
MIPHEGVYARLFASPIHGVGVIAIRDIKEGTLIFREDDDDLIWIHKERVTHLPSELRRLYDDFCIIKGDQYGCPRNFNLLTPAWYLNEPKAGDKPNVRANENYEFFASRDIKAGEELTIRYCTYSELPS